MEAALNFYQALALAILQGITEFLPVSSSGHLVLARRLFGWSDEGGLVFDTLLHAGSLLAILIYFWREWVDICRAYLSKSNFQFPISNFENTSASYYRKLPWLIIVATIPVVIAGPILKPLLESDAAIRNTWATGLSMIMTALLFLLAEYIKRPTHPCPSQEGIGLSSPPLEGWSAVADRGGSKTENRVSFPNALFIGCMQIIALLPGASRSGWTTSGGIFCGQKREQAVRFAFLMAVPAIAGAIIFQTKEIIHMPQASIDPSIMLSGLIVSFVSSLAAIHFCLKYFRKHSLRPFAVYLLIIGLISLVIK